MNINISEKTEKNIFIGIGIIGAIVLGAGFLMMADLESEKFSADLASSTSPSTSSNTTIIPEEKPIRIEKGYLLGGRILYKNTEKRISLGITSENTISTVQSIEVEMIQGRITPENYDESFENKRFILKEKVDSSEVTKVIDNHGGKNWAAIYLDLMIPDYKSSQMPEGDYTLAVTVHRNGNYQSQIFLPAKLQNSFSSCDINGDSFENMIDLVLTLKIMNGEISPSAEEKKKIDQNNNNILDLTDTMKIFKCVLNPKEAETSYFENECKKSVEPIEILLCPTGNSSQIRHIEHTPESTSVPEESIIPTSSPEIEEEEEEDECPYTDPVSRLLGC